MNVSQSLQRRRLEADEERLADSLAAMVNPDDPGESWGVGAKGKGAGTGAKQVWGIFEGESLIAALWLAAPVNGTARLPAMAVPRGRSRMGLLSYMLDELAPRSAQAGGREMAVTVERGGLVLAEALEDAGFVGPDPQTPGYPAGEWRRALD